MDIKPLKEIVTCSIHLGLMEDPRLLPCGHAFCCQCLDRHLHKASNHHNLDTSSNQLRFSCPLCRAPHPMSLSGGAQDFPKYFDGNVLIDLIRRCSDTSECHDASESANDESTPFTQPSPAIPPELPNVNFPSRRSRSVNTSRSPASSQNVSCEMGQRDLISSKRFMMKNCEYDCLHDNLRWCSMLPHTPMHHVGIHLVPQDNATHVVQYMIGCDGKTGDLQVCRDRVPLQSGRNAEAVVQQCWSLEEVSNMGRPEVQYVRFFKTRVYMTAIVRRVGCVNCSDSGDVPVPTDAMDLGMVICCDLPNTDEAVTTKGLTANNNMQKTEKKKKKTFSIMDISIQFLRDAVGMSQLDHPVIAGLDVDPRTDAVYVALCANAMIVRLNADNLKQIDARWFLNEPQLSPSFLCVAKHENEVWASCPLDGRVCIIDLSTDKFTFFATRDLSNIMPSHIVCTTDDRVMLLDKMVSKIYWLRRVQQSICSHPIQLTSRKRRSRGVRMIQSVDDTLVSRCLSRSTSRPLRGGLMCVDEEGAFLIYPGKVLRESNFRQMMCCL